MREGVDRAGMCGGMGRCGCVTRRLNMVCGGAFHGRKRDRHHSQVSTGAWWRALGLDKGQTQIPGNQ
eukprot:355293-Chlamydomonas_euryale.AAC.3